MQSGISISRCSWVPGLSGSLSDLQIVVLTGTTVEVMVMALGINWLKIQDLS
ncbi:MAG: hypothetical protein KZQ85_01525 [Candidatus Thiodiazotropha sp. (ex Myrtea sp. 'scaly one' KF741663)]|nr:hypothetical protein [Candidatus Thiodiazotropha sp. (ex Myrtea sp. 'scaly one' KF741663)]